MQTLECVRRDDGKTNWIVSENGNILDIFADKWSALDEYPEAVQVENKSAKSAKLSREDERANLPIHLALAILGYLGANGLTWLVFGPISTTVAMIISAILFASMINTIRGLLIKPQE